MALTLAEIKLYIHNWQTIRMDATELKKNLSLSISFSFLNKIDGESNLHVYPGVNFDKDIFYIFIVGANADEEENYDDIITIEVGSNSSNSDNEKSLSTVKSNTIISSVVGDGPISSETALDRIFNWRENRDSWIDSQSQINEGLFAAFNLPCDYMDLNVEYESFFALIENSQVQSGYTADLITMKKGFYNMANPVPPFSSTSFKLLN